MNYPPFAGESPIKSPWGFGWSSSISPVHGGDNARSNGHVSDSRTTSSRNSTEMNDEQVANMPEALLNTLKREKKPFTYTPGDVNLSEVLADKLQKRIERKKKHSMERAAQYLRGQNENDAAVDNFPVFEQPKQLLVMPTYNTPLNMYSVENALEVLEVQAEMAMKDKSFSAPKISHSHTLPRNHTFRFIQDEPPKNVTQSRAFRVLQVITDTDEEPPAQKDRYEKYFPEETRFTGLRDTKSIPSKFFHTLQRITGTEEEEEPQGEPALVAVSKVMNAQGNFTPGPTQVRSHQEPPQQMRQEERVTHQPQTNSPKFTVANQKTVVQQQKNGPLLKRPAAFLPANMTSSRFVSQQQSPPYFQRGPIDPRGGTNL